MAKEWNEHMKTLVKGSVANDLIVSHSLLNAAFEGAFHTAQINVVYMKDPDRKAHAEKALAELQNRFDGQKTSDSHL